MVGELVTLEPSRAPGWMICSADALVVANCKLATVVACTVVARTGLGDDLAVLKALEALFLPPVGRPAVC